MPKFSVVFLIWIVSILLSIWQKFMSLNDPTYNLTRDQASYMSFKAAFFVFFAIYFFLLLFWIVRAFAELKKMSNFGIYFSLN